jgi:hypothetical protein
VGRGIYFDHDYDPAHIQQAPGRIQVVGNQGLYMVYKGLERYVANAEYLSVLPDCSCVFRRCNKCTSMPYVVEVPSLSDELGLNFRSFWISKETLTNETNPISIGKVDNAKSSVWYADENGNEIKRSDGVYDVLICLKSALIDW